MGLVLMFDLGREVWFGLAVVKANDWFRVRTRARGRVRARFGIRVLFRISFRGKASV